MCFVGRNVSVVSLSVWTCVCVDMFLYCSHICILGIGPARPPSCKVQKSCISWDVKSVRMLLLVLSRSAGEGLPWELCATGRLDKRSFPRSLSFPRSARLSGGGSDGRFWSGMRSGGRGGGVRRQAVKKGNFGRTCIGNRRTGKEIKMKCTYVSIF